MTKFDDFIDALKDNISDLVREHWKDYSGAAAKDAQAFLEKTRDDLQRWTNLLAQGHLTRDDFEWLVKGKRDLAEMVTLQETGLALAQIDRFKAALLTTLVNTAFNIFL